MTKYKCPHPNCDDEEMDYQLLKVHNEHSHDRLLPDESEPYEIILRQIGRADCIVINKAS